MPHGEAAPVRFRRAPQAPPLRVVVLVSGAGSNLGAILEAESDPAFAVRVVAVAADRDDIGGLARAERAGRPTFVIRVRDFPTRGAWDAALTDQTDRYTPDLVVSAGFLKLVGPQFLARFAGRYLNTHNALLPAFPGMHGPADALAYGVRITGATLFFVDAGVDSGPILAQVAVPVEPGDDVATLTERIKVAERRQLVDQLGRLALSGWSITERKVTVG